MLYLGIICFPMFYIFVLTALSIDSVAVVEVLVLLVLWEKATEHKKTKVRSLNIFMAVGALK